MKITIGKKILLTILVMSFVIATLYSLMFIYSFASFHKEKDGVLVITEENAPTYVRELLQRSFTTLFLLSLFLVPFALFLSYSFSEPIARLRDAILAVGKGDLSTNIEVVSNDEIGQLADSFRDMRTKLHQSQEKMKTFNEHLEVKVQERTVEVQRASERIKKLLNARMQFVNQVSHDLRTPLVPIMGLLPILKEDLAAGDSRENRKIVETIAHNAQYLYSLVNDTLSIARLDATTFQLHMQQVDVGAIIKEVIDNNEIVFTTEGVHVTNNVPSDIPKVLADKTRIIEVLENLISNALKFMDANKHLVFSAQIGKITVAIRVTDTGIGIEKDDTKKIFGEFQRLDESRHKNSSGLGLSICKRIIEKHGGKIWVESAGKGTGTTFTFTLPFYHVATRKTQGGIHGKTAS
ncbi:MAG: HAMP domain-containing sensor histidine kinase [Candidatus Woesearchaeota archaeon]|nr:HAMP domain-containing sensor histidine kinase [Candidatus Woesearchaeota archaeon]